MDKSISEYKPAQIGVVSIIIPSFNPNELIFKTLESIRLQTFKNIEVVLVDDGSYKPASLDILNRIKEENRNIKILQHPQNRGLPAARNTGISASSGEYVFFLDGDDLIDATCIEKHFLTIQNNPTFEFVNSFVVGFGTQTYEWRGGFHDGQAFLYENRNTSCFMAKRSLFKQITFDESLNNGCEDWDFWLNAATKNLWGYTIPEFLFFYRRSDNADRWAVMKSAEALSDFALKLRKKYESSLVLKGFPQRHFAKYQYKPPQLDYDGLSLPGSAKRGRITKIMFIFPWLEIGGADKFNLDLLRGLKDKGWEITIVCSLKSNHPWIKEFQKITNDIFLLANYSLQYDYHKNISYLITSRQIEQIFISNSLYGYYLVPFLKKQYPHILIVDCIHCEDLNWMNGGYPRISTAFSHMLDKTFVSTRHLKDYIFSIREKNNHCPIEVFYTSIDSCAIKKDAQKRIEKRNSLGIPEDWTVILFSARVVEHKQPFVLADTIKNLMRHQDDFLCIVLGDGPLLEPLKKFIYENKLEGKIWCQGAVSHEEHLNYMDAADVFFLPSANEGIALTLYESMAKELVVVSSAVGGQPELVDESCGFLIVRTNPVEEVNQYATILSNIINNPERLDVLKLAARKKIESFFDLSQMLKQMDMALQRVGEDFSGRTAIEPSDYLFMLNQFQREEVTSTSLWQDIIYLREQNSTTAGLTKVEKQLSSDSEIFKETEWFRQENKKLREWYANEYDVLPLWYKRFGHIVSVLKGTRNFRSLLPPRNVADKNASPAQLSNNNVKHNF
jgi:glycosyltransferase involved in cell wall biosynthesis